MLSYGEEFSFGIKMEVTNPKKKTRRSNRVNVKNNAKNSATNLAYLILKMSSQKKKNYTIFLKAQKPAFHQFHHSNASRNAKNIKKIKYTKTTELAVKNSEIL